jgi:pimeloyl-ACP methyl ester carboxylesterase
MNSKILGVVATAGILAAAATGTDAQAAAAARTTVVLVHGAFADGSSWNKVIPLLQARGLDVVAVQNPLSSLADDVAATNRAMEQAKGPVVLVGHSWGGAVISQAGGNDKVKALVYVAAFALDKGESVSDLMKNGPPPPWAAALRKDSAGFLTLPPDTVAADFAQDLDSAQTQLMAATQGPWAERCLGDALTVGAWHNRPAWYVLAEKDRMIDPAAQGAMAARIGAKVTRVGSSHVPMLSHPAEVAAVIAAAAASIQ